MTESNIPWRAFIASGVAALATVTAVPAQAAEAADGWQRATGPAGSDVFVEDLAATGPNDLWAVGGRGGQEPTRRPVTARFDGHKWTSYPVKGGGDEWFTDVSGIGRELWATPRISKRIYRFSGGAWLPQPVARVAEGELGLSAVKVFGPRNVWAAGAAYQTEHGTCSAVVQHFDGRSWRNILLPASDARCVAIDGLNGTGPNDLWAVGEESGYGGGKHAWSPLALHWNGRDWRRVPVPTEHAGRLFNVEIVNGRPLAVGESGLGLTGPLRPLAYGWNGRAWAAQPTPAIEGRIRSASSDGQGGAWAVGQVGGPLSTDEAGKPLVLHFDGKSWTRAETGAGFDAGALNSVVTLAGGRSFGAGTGSPSGFAGSGAALFAHYRG